MLCASTLESTRLLLEFGDLQLERCAGQIPDGPHLSGRRKRHHAGAGSEGLGGNAPASEWDLHPSFPQREREGDERLHPRVRLSGWRYAGVRLRALLDSAKPTKTPFTRRDTRMQIGLWGECLARKENYVEIDKERERRVRHSDLEGELLNGVRTNSRCLRMDASRPWRC